MKKTRRNERTRVYRVKRRLASGEVREYVYARQAPKRKGPLYGPDALARVVDQWQKSPNYRALAPTTTARYERYLRILDDYRREPIGKLSRGLLLDFRDDIAMKLGPAAANAFIGTVSALMTFALERELIATHPLMKVRRLKGGEWRAWPQEAIDLAIERFIPSLSRAVVLALYTGQRAGDCIRMTWGEYDGEGIAVAQEKTGAKLWIPTHNALKAALATWPREAVTILADNRGRPWTAPMFRRYVWREIHKFPELSGLQFHGLRKSAAVRLAEAGCTEHEIGAITGHRTLQMIQHYTRDVEQRRLASAAIVKLQDAKRRK